jgi:hypothetical protein
MRLPRTLHRFYAWLLGYFWIPCPLCGRYFGGHEWHYPDVLSVIPKPGGGGTAICPSCTAAGLGKEFPPTLTAWAKAWDEGEVAGRHNEHEYRPNRLMKNPCRQEEQT